MAKKDSEHQKKSMSVLFRGKAIFKPLNTGRIDDRVACVREWVANIFFYTKNGTTIMIDAGYNYARLKEKMGHLDDSLMREVDDAISISFGLGTAAAEDTAAVNTVPAAF